MANEMSECGSPLANRAQTMRKEKCFSVDQGRNDIGKCSSLSAKKDAKQHNW